MNKYKEFKRNGKRVQQITRSVVDNFLVIYAASKDKLNQKFEKRIKQYQLDFNKMPDDWRFYLEDQFIAHQIFKEGGLIAKYLNHVEIGYRSSRELKYLRQQKEHPWRFSFSVIRDKPHPDFYMMHDLFTGGDYLLYSPGVSQLLFKIPTVHTWFNLIRFDGKCMQSYGPISYYKSFDREDIRFFSRQLNPDIETDEDIIHQIEAKPIPYCMLLRGALVPPVSTKSHRIKNFVAKYDVDDFRTEDFEGPFEVEYSEGIYRLGLKNWDEFPHYTAAYYDEKEQLLHLTAMTSKGFEELAKAVNACGIDCAPEPHDEVSPEMINIASNILGREITVNPFEELFKPPPPSLEDQKNRDAVNHYLDLLMDAINNNKEPDIRKMAAEANIDYQDAAILTKKVLEQFEKF
jgi:hypothetical protein